MSAEAKWKKISDAIRTFPNYPKPGVTFRDIFSLTKDPQLFGECIQLLVDHIRIDHPDVDVIVGIDSRGFIFGSLLAQQLQLPFVPLRKKGKLPGETLRVTYSLEYGEDCLEIQKDACTSNQKIIIVDDLLATGGTMKAAVELLHQLGSEVVECLVVIELSELGGQKKIPVPVWSLIKD